MPRQLVLPLYEWWVCNTFLAKEIEVQHMEFVQGKGKHKTPLQRLFEWAEALYGKRKEYEQQLYIMGERNSYSKTDYDATFMRMMLYGQRTKIDCLVILAFNYELTAPFIIYCLLKHYHQK